MICDVAKYQGAIDWKKLYESLDFVILRSSVGSKADERYAEYVAGCTRYGIPYHAYHYIKAVNEAEARSEAKVMADATAGSKPLFYVIDAEYSGIKAANARAICEAFEAGLRHYIGEDIRVAVYIGHHLYKSWALDYARYAYVWIPRYGSNNGQAQTEPDYPCDLWQYTSKGRVIGIDGDVDCNKLTGRKPMEFFTGRETEAVEQGGGNDVSAADKLIAIAEAEIGYLEKKSNKDLDDKTANVGDKNYTKYNRDMKAWGSDTAINAQWCQNFVDWCFVSTFGKEIAKRLLYTFTDYTPTGSNAFKKKNRYIKRGKGTPKRGDIIYFYSEAKGRIAHVGIVYKVSGSKVYTIEGNTSGASTLVTNGGGVKKKSYSMSSSYVDGYASVDYSIVDGDKELRKGDEGADVREMQKNLLLWCPNCLPKYGADGEFGNETETAVKDFQRSVGLAETGVYDAATKKALTAYGKQQFVEITGGSVNVRSAPGYDSKILGVAHKGDKLLYQGEIKYAEGKDWYLIAYENQNAWVSSKYAVIVEG